MNLSREKKLNEAYLSQITCRFFCLWLLFELIVSARDTTDSTLLGLSNIATSVLKCSAQILLRI